MNESENTKKYVFQKLTPFNDSDIKVYEEAMKSMMSMK